MSTAMPCARRSVRWSEAEFAYATGRIPEGKTLLTRGKGDAVIDMDPDELLALIRTGLGAAIDAKLALHHWPS